MAKFGVTYDSFELEASANLTEVHPMVFSGIQLLYLVKGNGLDTTKIAEAAKRSMHQYSGTAAMLSKACLIQYKVIVNEREIASGTADFSTLNQR
jgi:putative redox protein